MPGAPKRSVLYPPPRACRGMKDLGVAPWWHLRIVRRNQRSVSPCERHVGLPMSHRKRGGTPRSPVASFFYGVSVLGVMLGVFWGEEDEDIHSPDGLITYGPRSHGTPEQDTTSLVQVDTTPMTSICLCTCFEMLRVSHPVWCYFFLPPDGFRAAGPKGF